ncbi:hypothetical protein GA0061101_110131 [Rhizobium lusitanum]|uniref:Winged helix DNA-binding domain-containing protein n=1 Tax=Rhizobium lusitanum TaxID=293958 RepID=A0A1C3WDR1_9HYPH|nr:hypothetical protein GA0061101_110131 [Rhizobium lusitanum]
MLWLVRSLLKDNLVKYVNNPDHKRAKLLVFTERGRQLYKEVEWRQRIWTHEIGTSFNLENLQSTTQCIRRLGESIKGGDGNDDESEIGS